MSRVSWPSTTGHRGDMLTGRRTERGIALVATAISLVALLAIAAIALEVARLTDTATEVQVAADSAALAAALAISQNLSGQAAANGKSAAAANTADARSVDPSGVQIDIGHYNSDPTASPHFTTTCTAGVDCNAARATVTVSNVNYIMAGILNGQTGTNVLKNAVAFVPCQGSGTPVPLAVCQQVLHSIPQDDLCGTTSISFTMNPQAAQNACWTSLDTSVHANTSYDLTLFPPQCGGTPVSTTLQQQIELTNGVADKVYKALQCCIQCHGIHDFTVTTIDCTGLILCTGAEAVTGFATIHIANATDVSVGNGNTQCSQFSWGCSATVNNSTPGSSQITARQICKSDLPGKPGGTNCTNFANTVAPVLGQVP